MSTTLNQYNLGIIGSGSWFGEEDIILGRDYSLTVACLTAVKVFKITKMNLLSIPVDIKKELQERIEQKKDWLNNRRKTISQTSSSVFQLNSFSSPQYLYMKEMSESLPKTRKQKRDFQTQVKTLLDQAESDKSHCTSLIKEKKGKADAISMKKRSKSQAQVGLSLEEKFFSTQTRKFGKKSSPQRGKMVHRVSKSTLLKKQQQERTLLLRYLQ